MTEQKGAPDSVLRINDLVGVRVLEGPYAGEYPSRVAALNSEIVTLLAPLTGGAVTPVHVGTSLLIQVVRPDLHRGHGLEGDAVLLQRWYEDRVALWDVSRPRQWRKFQRRSFFRIDAALAVALLPQGEGQEDWRSYQSRNISGGGLLVVGPPLSPGTKALVRIELPEREVRAEGVVVRCCERGEAGRGGRNTPAELGLRFTAIDPADQDRIVRFVLERQAELRRKGLV